MKVKALTCAALFLFASSALAGSAGHKFDSYDKNSDGYISADELGSEKAHKIQKLDSDGDGQISKEEFMSHKGKKRPCNETA